MMRDQSVEMNNIIWDIMQETTRCQLLSKWVDLPDNKAQRINYALYLMLDDELDNE